MTAFYNLDEALSYRRYCPCKHCSHSLFPETATIKYGDRRREVEFAIGGDKLTVCSHSNAVISYHEKQEDNLVYGGMRSPTLMYAGSSRHLWSLSKSGTDMFPVTVSCNNCHRYNYVLQVHVSLAQGLVLGLVLNSESITIEDMAKLYTITNIYTFEKTEMEVRHMHVSHLHESQSKIEYPLIPLNVEEPMKTVERLKKLTVFL